MDLGREMLAAIGEVVIESTMLEHTLAQLVAVRWGWEDGEELSMIARPGGVRNQMLELIEADPDWDAARQLWREAVTLLDKRHRIVHSLVVYVTDDDHEVRDIELWNAKYRTMATLPPVSAVEKLSHDIGRCVVATVMTIPEAGRRFSQLGASAAPTSPPKPSPMTAWTADGGLETA